MKEAKHKPEDLIERVQLGLNDRQYTALKEILTWENEAVAEYVKNAIVGRMEADIDGHFKVGDPRRTALMQRIGRGDLV